MTIYDLQLYGVYFPHLVGGGHVRLSTERIDVRERRENFYRFVVTALKQYGTKQDVLELQFDDGRTEYVTLYEPTMYLDDGEWKSSEKSDTAVAFLKMYELLKEKEIVDSAQSIFDLTFYGLLEDIGLKMLRAKVSLFKVARDSALTKDSVLFTAVILKEYRGKGYVAKCTTEEGVDAYIPLFEANTYYNTAKRKWERYNESPIPAEILKCYVEYLNE